MSHRRDASEIPGHLVFGRPTPIAPVSSVVIPPGHPELHTMSSHIDRERGADLASADPLVFGTDGDFVHLTGTTPINSISGGVAGDRHLVRIMSPGLSIVHTTGLLNMLGKLTLISQSDDISEFVCESPGIWTEIRRAGSNIGADQVIEIGLVIADGSGAPTIVDSSSTGTGTAKAISIALETEIPGDLVDTVIITP